MASTRDRLSCLGVQRLLQGEVLFCKLHVQLRRLVTNRRLAMTDWPTWQAGYIYAFSDWLGTPTWRNSAPSRIETRF